MNEGGLLLVILVHPATPVLHHHVIDPALAVVTIIPLLLNEGNIQGMWPLNNSLFSLHLRVSNNAILLI